jgi:hypothetical protein
MGRMTDTLTLFEPYRNPVSEDDLRSCLLKVLIAQSKKRRDGRRQNSPLAEEQLPSLWIFTPTCSERIIAFFLFQHIENIREGYSLVNGYQHNDLIRAEQSILTSIRGKAETKIMKPLRFNKRM